MKFMLVADDVETGAEVLRVRYRANVVFPEDGVGENSFLRSALYVTSHGEGNWPMAMRRNDKIEGRL